MSQMSHYKKNIMLDKTENNKEKMLEALSNCLGITDVSDLGGVHTLIR